jgi:hypothetical protein
METKSTGRPPFSWFGRSPEKANAKVACPDEGFHNDEMFEITFCILIDQIFILILIFIFIFTIFESRVTPKFDLFEEISSLEKVFADIFDHFSYPIYGILVNSMNAEIIYKIYFDLGSLRLPFLYYLYANIATIVAIHVVTIF